MTGEQVPDYIRALYTPQRIRVGKTDRTGKGKFGPFMLGIGTACELGGRDISISANKQLPQLRIDELLEPGRQT